MKKSLFSAIFLTLLAVANVATAQIQMTFTVVQPSCNGFTNGSATVFAVGGSGAYTYLWSTSETTQTSFGIGAGLYSVTVTDAAQNTTSGSITVTEPGAVTAAITASGVNCQGNSGTLTAAGFGGTPPYTYTWDGPNSSASESVDVTAPGNYFITITDANNCSGVASYTVAEPLSVSVTATDIPCSYYPEGGAVNAIVLGGTTPYSYYWSNGSTGQSLIEVGADTYSLTVTAANGCTASGSDVVDIPSPLEVEITWLTPACGGVNNGAATVQASGGTPPYTHSWTPGGFTGASQTGLAPGQYYVCTFDANQCQNDIWINIPATTGLDVSLVVTSATCVGINNATATAIVSPLGSGYQYQWNILPADSNVTQITGLAAGTVISVTVTDPVSGCSGTATGTVGAHDDVDVFVTDVDILCAGGFGSANAIASGGTPQYTYTWLTGSGVVIGNEASIGGLSPGAYLVTVVDSVGCIGQGVADISILSDPHALIHGDSVLICGDSLSLVQFTNLSFDTYNQITTLVWIVTGPSVDTVINQQSQVVFYLPVDETIIVQLIATSGLGCSDTATLIYNVPGFPDITLSLDSSSINCVGAPVAIDVIGGDSSYTYVWTPAVTFNPNPLHVLVSPTETTTYVLTATDGNACTATDSITVNALDSLLQLFVSDTLIQSCESTAILSATSSIPATIVWTDPNGTVLPGNPITVPATPNTTVYTVTAVTADSCISTEQVSVTGYGFELAIDPNGGTSACEGDSLPLSVIVSPMTDSLTYQWSVTDSAMILNPGSANPFLVGPAGTYTVTVIVSNLYCADTLSFTVEILPGFNLDGLISANLCEGLLVSFTNLSGLSGQWSFGDNTVSDSINPVHEYSLEGNYVVIFTPTLLECTAAWDSMIYVNQDTLFADISHQYEDCAIEAKIRFTGSTNSPEVSTWSWTFSNGTPTVSSDQNPVVTYTDEGMYIATLVVTDMNQCTATATDSVQVDIVNDEIMDEISICLKDTIELNAVGIDPDATYTWTATPADPTLDPNNPNPLVSPLVPTVYSVEISQGFCTEEFNLSVLLKAGSDVELPEDTVVCNTSAIPITAQSNGPASYEWSTSPSFTNIFATTQTVDLQPTGTYYVRTTSLEECFDVDSIRIAVEMVEVQVEPIDDDICLGEQTVLFVTNLDPAQNLTYTWSPTLPNMSTPIVSPTENTTYAVTVTNQFGCTSTLEFAVNVTTTSVDATADPTEISFADPSTTLDATTGGNGNVISYEWTPAGTLSNPNSPQTEANPTETTLYTITTKTDDGCIATDTVRVDFRFSECVSPFVFIPNTFTPNNDQKNDFFRVYADGMTELKMIIWNRWGEIIYETNDPNTLGWDGTYRGRELSADSYAWYVVLTCGNGDIFESKGNVTLLK